MSHFFVSVAMSSAVLLRSEAGAYGPQVCIAHAAAHLSIQPHSLRYSLASLPVMSYVQFCLHSCSGTAAQKEGVCSATCTCRGCSHISQQEPCGLGCDRQCSSTQQPFPL
jgi:hypothetical protein